MIHITCIQHLHSSSSLLPCLPQELLREELAELLKLSGTSFKVELVMRLLGLSHVRDTMIGSAMVSVFVGAVAWEMKSCLQYAGYYIDECALQAVDRHFSSRNPHLHAMAAV